LRLSNTATKLGSAGRRAFARGDLPAAANLLRRAAALVEPDTTPRIELDLEYIDSWSPLLDLKILMRTIPAVLSGRGAS